MNSIEAREYLINNPGQWCIVDNTFVDETGKSFSIYYRWDDKTKRYQVFSPKRFRFNSFNAVIDDGENRFINFKACAPLDIDEHLLKTEFWELFSAPIEKVKNYSKDNPEFTYDNLISCIKYLWDLDKCQTQP